MFVYSRLSVPRPNACTRSAPSETDWTLPRIAPPSPVQSALSLVHARLGTGDEVTGAGVVSSESPKLLNAPSARDSGM